MHTYIHTYYYKNNVCLSAAGKSVSFWRPADKTNALTDHLADIDAIHFYSAVNFGQITFIQTHIHTQ